ncbi:MAG: hypothetical protein P4L59_06490 [Desulfosporosinus sp.]|nr:hypothetical protein [Desulfosporosinus sp.]
MRAGFPAKATSDGHGWPSVPGAKDGGRGPCRMAGGTHPTTMDGLVSPEPRMAEGDLVFRPAYERGFKAEFGYDERKGVGPCDRGPSGLGRRKGRFFVYFARSCFPRCGKSEIAKKEYI